MQGSSYDSCIYIYLYEVNCVPVDISVLFFNWHLHQSRRTPHAINFELSNIDLCHYFPTKTVNALKWSNQESATYIPNSTQLKEQHNSIFLNIIFKLYNSILRHFTKWSWYLCSMCKASFQTSLILYVLNTKTNSHTSGPPALELSEPHSFADQNSDACGSATGGCY